MSLNCMNKSPQEIKQMIEQWVKITNAHFEDITTQEKPKQPRLEWIFKINNFMAVYMMEGRSDRVSFSAPINFAPIHQDALLNLSDKDFLEFLVAIIEPLAIAGITPQLIQNNKEIKQISLENYIDTETLSRDKFFRIWDQLSTFKELVIKKVQLKLDPSSINNASNSFNSENQFYG